MLHLIFAWHRGLEGLTFYGRPKVWKSDKQYSGHWLWFGIVFEK